MNFLSEEEFNSLDLEDMKKYLIELTEKVPELPVCWNIETTCIIQYYSVTRSILKQVIFKKQKNQKYYSITRCTIAKLVQGWQMVDIAYRKRGAAIGSSSYLHF